MAFLGSLTRGSRHWRRLFAVVLVVLPILPSLAQDRVPRSVQLRGAPEEMLNRLRREVAEEIRRIEAPEGRAADVADTAYTMEQYLRSNGFARAAVEYRMLRITSTDALEAVRTAAAWADVRFVEFLVSPGKLTYFGTVSFTGNSHFSVEKFREQVPIAGRRPSDNPVPFELSRVSSAVRRIENMYTLAGFADARVGPAQQQNRETDDSIFVDVTIPIAEGVRYVISDVRVNAPDVPASLRTALGGGLGIRESVYYSRKIVEGEVEISRILSDAGYRPEIATTTNRDPVNGFVEVHYEVTAGPLYVLGEVHVVQPDDLPLRTKEQFIRGMVPLSSGDVLRSEKLDQLEDRLYGLGIFSLVVLTEEPQNGRETPGGESDGEPNTIPVDLTISVREASSRYVEIAAGWGSYELLRGRVTYTDNNLAGRALSWRTTGALSFRTREISSSLTDRRFLGPDLRITVDSAYGYRDGPSYNRTSAEAGVGAYYTLSELWEVDLTYRFAYTLADAIRAQIPGEERDVLATGRIGTGAGFDSRDSVLLPTRGQRLGAHVFWASSTYGSDIRFWGIDVEGATHHRITDSTHLAMVGSYRTRVRLDSDRTLPIQERLFLGGSQNVRSFIQDHLGPGAAGSPIGGLSSAHASVELRQRIVGNVFLAALFDIGTVRNDSWDINGPYGFGVGLGVRYHLPIGPLRLDVAYNPGETFTQDSRWAVHFAVGHSF